MCYSKFLTNLLISNGILYINSIIKIPHIRYFIYNKNILPLYLKISI
ncbi:hypothetical protein HMPREF1860_00878 [Prevotella amnii]|uniref:Uncharacterized protein n=1 Tax=Prevotella amnii TaxID=419005 RepID=A0A134BFU6_9BACT|nr:hypothetical protein HMPREF1860_00878 [Prevotella amnii]